MNPWPMLMLLLCSCSVVRIPAPNAAPLPSHQKVNPLVGYPDQLTFSTFLSHQHIDGFRYSVAPDGTQTVEILGLEQRSDHALKAAQAVWGMDILAGVAKADEAQKTARHVSDNGVTNTVTKGRTAESLAETASKTTLGLNN